ncbi:hypothetical protein VPH35_032769 [Triticum aestivum]
MGNVEQHLGNATPTTLLHYQLSDMWRSPRGPVLRIEGLALVAIACSFFLVAFGSCRRWSNSWIIQKGFLAAQVLSLSLGTYSIGLMQSSPVKSEMYPIWAVSLLTLFGCIDPVTTYVGLEYKGPLLKIIFQLCLYCGYVLLMSVSTISGGVGKLAIGLLSVITFIKGFHMSLALVLPSRTRERIEDFIYIEPIALAGGGEKLRVLLYEDNLYPTRMEDIRSSCNEMVGKLKLKEATTNGIEDVCLGYSLSHLLQRRFLGLATAREMELKIEEFENVAQTGRAIDYKRTLKAIEVELAFLYDMFFTSNWFLHCYESKTSSFWAFASFIGICLVGVALAIPGAMSSRHRVTGSNSPSAGTIVVNTTRGDLTITLVILVSMALLQLMQLIRCWTSNLAQVAFACQYDRNEYISNRNSWWMRLKAFVVTRMNWFDKYLWQDKLGQYSLVDEKVSRRKAECRMTCAIEIANLCVLTCYHLSRIVGLHYFGRVLWELWACDTSTAVRLHDDVKASIADFLGKIKSRRIGVEWSSLFLESTLKGGTGRSDAYAFSHRVMVWHVATRYCELADLQEGNSGGGGGSSDNTERNRHVAMALSRYCAYLVVSASELSLGHLSLLEAMQQSSCLPNDHRIFGTGVHWGMRLRNDTPPPPGCTPRSRCDDHWEVLALLWVQTLLYAAPYGDMQRHMQHLSQGGEFITHLWALLYHIGIDRWDREPEAAAETTQTPEAAQVHGDAREEEIQEIN